MKLILIHGGLQELVSKKISEIKKNFDDFGINEGEEGLTSQSLFSEKRLVILNDPEIGLIEKALLQTDPELTVVLRFPKNLEKSSPILKKLTTAKIETFGYNEQDQKNIFPLLDLIGNKKPQAFSDFEKNYKDFGGQYILVMLSYFLRRMIAKPKSGGSSFMAQKIQAQKRNFNLEKITQCYKDLIETDFKIKKGFMDEKDGVTLLVQRIIN